MKSDHKKTRVYNQTLCFNLIEDITKMGGDQNFVSLYHFNRIVDNYAEAEQCKLCNFYFESSYLNNTHTSLCSPIKRYNKEVMEAVQTLASYALEKSGVAHPNKTKASNHTSKSMWMFTNCINFFNCFMIKMSPIEIISAGVLIAGNLQFLLITFCDNFII